MGQQNLASRIVPEKMMAGVNKWKEEKPPVAAYERFRQELNRARENAENMYHSLRRTGSAADRIRFEKARVEFMQLNNQAEEFNRQISKAARSELSIGNMAKRAGEAANWKIGNAIENSIVNTPINAFHDIKEYELAMAGVMQVLPKLELGQQNVNEEFQAFTDIAGKYGQSVKDVLEAGKSIGRMYGHGNDERGDYSLGAENTNILTKQAAKMATVDNFDVLEATRGLESALAQFNMQTNDSNLLMARSSHILDIWTSLAHQSGASAQDLTEGVRQAGASAHAAGVSFEFLNALIATGVRNTAKTGNEIGTMLKSMFSSMQSDKAIKAMQDFGIEVYRVGETGKTEMRPLQDLIMDISLALKKTPKDTKGVTDFLLAISGGKFQVSKVSALLHDYEEIQRTLGVARNSAGFTNKQLEYQMDTMYRKIETLKANIAAIFQQAGSDGLVNDMKWILNLLIRITKGMSSTESHAYTWTKRILTLVAAYKLIPAVLDRIARASGRAVGAWNATRASGVGIMQAIAPNGIHSSRLSANYQSRRDSQFNRQSEYLARATSASSTVTNTSSTSVNAAAHANAAKNVSVETAALGAQNGALRTNTAAHSGNTTALIRQSGATSKATIAQNSMRSSLLGTSVVLASNGARVRSLSSNYNLYARNVKESAKQTKNLASSMSKVGSASKNGMGAIPAVAQNAKASFNGAASAGAAFLGLLGGIKGMLIAIAATAVIHFVIEADGIGEAAEKTEKMNQEMEDAIVTAQEMEEQSRRNGEEAEKLATKYNELADELNKLESAADSSSDSLNRQNEIKEQMGLISDRVATILHANSDEFMEDGKMNLGMIKKLSKADRDKAIAAITNKESEVDADIEATNAAIQNTQGRIDALKAEMYAAGKLSIVYRALYGVIASVRAIMAHAAHVGKDLLSDDRGKQYLAAMQLGGLGVAALPGVEVVKAIMGKDRVANEIAWLSKSEEWATSQAWENIAKMTDPNLDPEKMWDMEDLAKSLPALEEKRSSSEAQKAKIHDNLTRVQSVGIIDPTNENLNYDKETELPKEKGRKGKGKGARGKKGRKKKEEKEDWSFDSEYDKGIAAISEGENSPLKGKVSPSLLLALGAAISGNNDVHGMKTNLSENPFGVTPDMWEKYAAKYTRNAHNSFGVFADVMAEVYGDGVASDKDAVKKYLLQIGKSEEDANAIVSNTLSKVEYLDKHYDFKNAEKAVPTRKRGSGGGFSGVSGNASDFSELMKIDPRTVEERMAWGMQAWMLSGYSKEQAAGAMGNLRYESGGRLDPSAYTPNDGDGTPSYGIAQWHKSRYTGDNGLISWANANGSDYRDFRTQIMFAIHEAGNRGDMFGGASTVDSATENFMNKFEIPSEAAKNQSRNQRRDFAQEAYKVSMEELGFSSISNKMELLDKSILNNLGQVMKNHRVGCVEAVDQILAGVDEYFVGLYNEKVFNVSSLVARMMKDGYSVIPFDESQLEKGDIITFNKKGFSNIEGDPVAKDNNHNVHVMLYKGDGNIVGNSSEEDKIIERTLASHKTFQNPAWIIKTNLRGGSGSDRYADDNLARFYGTDNGSIYSLQYDYAKEFQKFVEQSEESYKTAAKAIEQSKSFFGDNFFDSQKEYNNELKRSLALLVQKNTVEEAYMSAQKKVTDFLKRHPEIERILKSDNMTWDRLTIDEQKDRFEKAGGKDSGKIVEQAESLRKLNSEIEAQYREQKYKVDSMRGYLSPRAAYEYRRERLSSNDGVDRDWFEQTERARQEKELAETELYRLRTRLAQERVENEKEIAHAQEIAERLKDQIQELKKKKDLTDEEKKKLEEMNSDYEVQTSIIQNGTAAYREAEKAVRNQQQAVKEASETYRKLSEELGKVKSDFATDFFDKLIVQGNSLREILSDIVKQIASITIRRSFDNIFGVKHEDMNPLDSVLGGKYSHKDKAPQEFVSNWIYRSSFFPHLNNSTSVIGETGSSLQGLSTAINAQTVATAANTTTTAAGTTAQTLGNAATQLSTLTQQSSTVTEASVTTANTMALNGLTSQMASSSISGGVGGSKASGFFGLSSIFGLFSKGGAIPGFASGGSGSGLIRGAGTGTSDSILTYLAHRKQFIRTSNGEYIIKKDSVDKLGVPFLDMLNNQPELAPAMDGFKRYMDGGSLGTSMSPSMKASTMESYRRFNRANGAIKMASNEKMENLLAGLREDVREGNRQDTPVQPVILNTQASSAEVMKAIAKNPRAFNKIMGGHQKHGFR